MEEGLEQGLRDIGTAELSADPLFADGFAEADVAAEAEACLGGVVDDVGVVLEDLLEDGLA